MYQYSNRSSIRRGQYRNFNRPSRNGFFGNRPRQSQNGRQNQSKLIGQNPSMFIKKAAEAFLAEDKLAHLSFENFSINQILKQNIKNKGYITPTPIQDQAIEPILQGRDVVGTANTGTGKTAAFLIPIINQIFEDRKKRALVIVPTRELALQIHEEYRSLTFGMQLYSTFVIGGSGIGRQIQELRRFPNVVIGTPGRLKDLIQRRYLNLENFSIIVLDEVDLMVDIGFITDVKYFISLLPKVRQSLFFSATISGKIQEILSSFVNNPVRIELKVQPTAEGIDQDIVRVSSPAKKIDHLHDLLLKDGFDKVLIFGKTKRGVEKLNKELNFRGFKVGAIHGNRSQGQRKRVLESFKQNQIQILLATDVASRGLDIDNVTHVINYDLPQTYNDYIHRIGRTGRAGKTGKALTFIT